MKSGEARTQAAPRCLAKSSRTTGTSSLGTCMIVSGYEERVRQVLAHYEAQGEDEAVAEDEAALSDQAAVSEFPQEHRLDLVPQQSEPLLLSHEGGRRPAEEELDCPFERLDESMGRILAFLEAAEAEVGRAVQKVRWMQSHRGRPVPSGRGSACSPGYRLPAAAVAGAPQTASIASRRSRRMSSPFSSPMEIRIPPRSTRDLDPSTHVSAEWVIE